MSGVLRARRSHLFRPYVYFALIANIANIIFEYHEESMIVLFLVLKLQIMDKKQIANHYDPDVNGGSTACVDCDSNTISVPSKIISNDKVNFSEPLSQLQHANAPSQNLKSSKTS